MNFYVLTASEDDSIPIEIKYVSSFSVSSTLYPTLHRAFHCKDKPQPASPTQMQTQMTCRVIKFISVYSIDKCYHISGIIAFNVIKFTTDLITESFKDSRPLN
ncbi:CLUMA_CG017813, isoform A [Clunio marinus]|uniref:CLUMA_CG017813, isoform A n=1 Tax=Clunio marinus TaxID=568069 RepID=A0A1J1J1L5_9DIPT|nr:CLUMA_CG017813, isoform A [Clunio marinus]